MNQMCSRILCGIALLCLAIVPRAYAGESSLSRFVESTPTAIVFDKSSQTATLYQSGKPMTTFRAVFGVNPNGDKERRGDYKTPEGMFYIVEKERISDPYLGKKWFGISYPDVGHAESGLRQQLIGYDEYRAILQANQERMLPPQETNLGGYIGIHGGRDDLTRQGINWTEGCIAMTDTDLETLYAYIHVGTPIVIMA